jgi:hypothetical protein
VRHENANTLHPISARPSPAAIRPHPERGQIKARGGRDANRPLAGDECHQQDADGPRRQGARAAAHDRQEQQGDEQVKLLLDGQRPGVYQGLQLGGGLEIAGLQPEEDVRGKAGRREQAARKSLERVRQEQEAGRRAAGREDDHERREEPADAPLVESGEREAARRALGEDQRGDEVAGDDEEDVDADVTAACERESAVVQEHRDDRDGPQAVDVGAVADRGMSRRILHAVVCWPRFTFCNRLTPGMRTA